MPDPANKLRPDAAAKRRSRVGNGKPAATRPESAAAGRSGAAKRRVASLVNEPVLLAGGNPQIAKAEGDAPVQAYIAAMPGWKSDLGRRLDALIVRNVPDVRKAVKWNSPFYGIEGQGWFLAFHVFTRCVKVSFFKGTSLRPVPPGGSGKDARWIDIHEDDFDEAQLAAWIRQAATMPGWQVRSGRATRATRPVPTPKAESASELIDARIEQLGDWRGEMLARLRSLIKQADPEVTEQWKWATPVWSHDGIVCTGETYKKTVKMTFPKGASLPDPEGLFNSSLEGKVRRAIDLHEGAEIDERALKALIRAAVALNRSSARG